MKSPALSPGLLNPATVAGAAGPALSPTGATSLPGVTSPADQPDAAPEGEDSYKRGSDSAPPLAALSPANAAKYFQETPPAADVRGGLRRVSVGDDTVRVGRFQTLPSTTFTFSHKDRTQVLRDVAVYLVKDEATLRGVVDRQMSYAVMQHDLTSEESLFLADGDGSELLTAHDVIQTLVRQLASKPDLLTRVKYGFIFPSKGRPGQFDLYELPMWRNWGELRCGRIWTELISPRVPLARW